MSRFKELLQQRKIQNQQQRSNDRPTERTTDLEYERAKAIKEREAAEWPELWAASEHHLVDAMHYLDEAVFSSMREAGYTVSEPVLGEEAVTARVVGYDSRHSIIENKKGVLSQKTQVWVPYGRTKVIREEWMPGNDANGPESLAYMKEPDPVLIMGHFGVAWETELGTFTSCAVARLRYSITYDGVSYRSPKLPLFKYDKYAGFIALEGPHESGEQRILPIIVHTSELQKLKSPLERAILHLADSRK